MKLPESLRLHVETKGISPEDAARQTRSAHAILSRLAVQPGVVLGDEVGMGKTFVALAVASAYILENPSRPVVVMAPKGVVDKWVRDAETFKHSCLLADNDRKRFRVDKAETALEFLKLLDDPVRHRATLIILAHGALNRGLADSWNKLAVLQAAIKGRRGADDVRRRLAKFGPAILQTRSKTNENLMRSLLETPTSQWKQILVSNGLLGESDDDPVPALVAKTLPSLDLDTVYQRVLEVLPIRKSGDQASMHARLQRARDALNNAGSGVLPAIWRQVLMRMRLRLPLLVLDEAHHVRNGTVRLAQLLKQQEEGMEEAAGPLSHRFDRMLFLTATPFQLGHHELCNVLSRFESIAWGGRDTPAMTRPEFVRSIGGLKLKLDAMQLASECLERSWKRLNPMDLEEAATHGGQWWDTAESPQALANERLIRVSRAYSDARDAIRSAEADLRRWVIRSSRAVQLPGHAGVDRRERLEGAAVLAELEGQAAVGGLRVTSDNALPFLLAARLASVPGARRVLGEGLASSYQAFLNTELEKDARSADRPMEDSRTLDARFHEDRLLAVVGGMDPATRRMHPKICATVRLAMDLWRRGEKVLIFCHYRRTGQALQAYLSDAMLEAIQHSAAAKMGCSIEDVEARLNTFTDRLSKDRAGEIRHEIDGLLAQHPALMEPATRDRIHDVVLRFLRTPTFLVRYADLDEQKLTPDWMRSMLDRADGSSLTLRAVLTKFATFLAVRCNEKEREAYLDALHRVQTGVHVGTDADSAFEDDTPAAGERIRLVANVRRVYGDTKDETRRRIMLTFNTPFYPEILIASSVLGEGVDLHLNCRHVIHHDLDWNPSSLEQRTGRIDRLGSKAEEAGHPIRVYLPYVEGCQDEKLFRVVVDRERWFGVVMGAEESMGRVLGASAWELEKVAEQAIVPEPLVESLRLRLEPASGETAGVTN